MFTRRNVLTPCVLTLLLLLFRLCSGQGAPMFAPATPLVAVGATGFSSFKSGSNGFGILTLQQLTTQPLILNTNASHAARDTNQTTTAAASSLCMQFDSSIHGIPAVLLSACHTVNQSSTTPHPCNPKAIVFNGLCVQPLWLASASYSTTGPSLDLELDPVAPWLNSSSASDFLSEIQAMLQDKNSDTARVVGEFSSVLVSTGTHMLDWWNCRTSQRQGARQLSEDLQGAVFADSVFQNAVTGEVYGSDVILVQHPATTCPSSEQPGVVISVPADKPLSVYADSVYFCGGLNMPAKHVQVFARHIACVAERCEINTSGANGEAGAKGADGDKPGDSGATGGAGGNGQDGGNIILMAYTFGNADKFGLTANGGNGGRGGTGGDGKNGQNGAKRQYSHCQSMNAKSTSNERTVFDIGTDKGTYKLYCGFDAEDGGNGGNAGLNGINGKGGNSGSVVVYSYGSVTKAIPASLVGGIGASNDKVGAAGEGGSAGTGGRSSIERFWIKFFGAGTDSVCYELKETWPNARLSWENAKIADVVVSVPLDNCRPKLTAAAGKAGEVPSLQPNGADGLSRVAVQYHQGSTAEITRIQLMRQYLGSIKAMQLQYSLSTVKMMLLTAKSAEDVKQVAERLVWMSSVSPCKDSPQCASLQQQVNQLILQMSAGFGYYNNPPGWVPTASLGTIQTHLCSTLLPTLKQLQSAYNAYNADKSSTEKVKAAAEQAIKNLEDGHVKLQQLQVKAGEDLVDLRAQKDRLYNELEAQKTALQASATQLDQAIKKYNAVKKEDEKIKLGVATAFQFLDIASQVVLADQSRVGWQAAPTGKAIAAVKGVVDIFLNSALDMKEKDAAAVADPLAINSVTLVESLEDIKPTYDNVQKLAAAKGTNIKARAKIAIAKEKWDKYIAKFMELELAEDYKVELRTYLDLGVAYNAALSKVASLQLEEASLKSKREDLQAQLTKAKAARTAGTSELNTYVSFLEAGYRAYQELVLKGLYSQHMAAQYAMGQQDQPFSVDGLTYDHLNKAWADLQEQLMRGVESSMGANARHEFPEFVVTIPTEIKRLRTTKQMTFTVEPCHQQFKGVDMVFVKEVTVEFVGLKVSDPKASVRVKLTHSGSSKVVNSKGDVLKFSHKQRNTLYHYIPSTGKTLRVGTFNEASPSVGCGVSPYASNNLYASLSPFTTWQLTLDAPPSVDLSAVSAVAINFIGDSKPLDASGPATCPI